MGCFWPKWQGCGLGSRKTGHGGAGADCLVTLGPSTPPTPLRGHEYRAAGEGARTPAPTCHHLSCHHHLHLTNGDTEAQRAVRLSAPKWPEARPHCVPGASHWGGPIPPPPPPHPYPTLHLSGGHHWRATLPGTWPSRWPEPLGQEAAGPAPGTQRKEEPGSLRVGLG